MILDGTLSSYESEVWRGLFDNFAPLSRLEFPELQKALLGISGRDFDTVLQTVKRAELDQIDHRGRTTLSWAAARGKLDAVQQLLQRGADPDKADMSGKTPCHWCSTSTQCLKALLDAGADIGAITRDGRTIMMEMIKYSHGEIMSFVELLLARGADVSAKSDDGYSALHFTVTRNDPRTVSYLLQNGADVNAMDNTGGTPLGMSVVYNSDKALKALLDHEQLDYTLRDSERGIILHDVAACANLSVLRVLRSAGLKGLNVNAKNIKGLTALEYVRLRRDSDGSWPSSDILFRSDEDPLKVYEAFVDLCSSIDEASTRAWLHDENEQGIIDVDQEDDDDDEGSENEQWVEALESQSKPGTTT